jgi:hypothetical protein
MRLIQKNIIIAKPAEVIWSILDNPARRNQLNPGFKLAYFFEAQPGGYDQVFEYRLGGKKLKVGSHMVTYEHARHMAYKTCGGLHSTWHWWLETDGHQTHVALTVEFEPPAGWEALAFDQALHNMLDTELTNLKQIVQRLAA